MVARKITSSKNAPPNKRTPRKCHTKNAKTFETTFYKIKNKTYITIISMPYENITTSETVKMEFLNPSSKNRLKRRPTYDEKAANDRKQHFDGRTTR